MNTIYKIASCACALLAALSVISCTGNEDALSHSEGINITFRTAAAAEAQVRSTPTAGVDSLNENLLNSVYYFLYPTGQTSVTPSVSGYKTGISETGTYQVKVPVSANTVVNDLFASSNECHLFAVANPPATIVSALEGKPTLAALRALAVASSLTKIPQDNFTLVYDGPIEATSLSQKVAVNAVVEMKHLAAKFTIGAIVIPSLIQGTDTYTPDGLSVKLCNGINKTTLSGWNADAVDRDNYFDTEYKTMTNSGAVTVDSETYQEYGLSTPIYSYPMEWEFNSETEPYLMYELNWKITEKDGNTAWKPLYYKLTLGSRSVMQNEWYDISAKLTVLGSLFPEEPTQIYYYMDYLVNGWKNALPNDNDINTPATIKDTRYLAVNQTEWTLNNKNEVTIPFSSSHECSYANLTATKKNFSNGTPTNTPVTGVTVDTSVPNQVTVRHNLNNKLENGMDISPIEITFTLCHNDNPGFSQQIHITQYPAIYVNTEANSAGQGTGGQNSDGKLGTVYINNAQSTASGDWRRIAGATSSGNNSSYFFTVITVSQFDPSTGYVVGDPRDPNVNNLDVSNWGMNPSGSAPAKYNGDGQTGNRQLKYYHPTIDDGSRDNFVAPKFRVSSAYCRSRQNNSYEDVKKRCASYQEDGYPAGRWRLPTLAECKLIQVLSGNGMVPNIFIQNGSSYYYAAGWWFTVSNTGVGSYNHSTSQNAAGRCVYDEWYWEIVDNAAAHANDPTWRPVDKSTFTWGDVPDNY